MNMSWRLECSAGSSYFLLLAPPQTDCDAAAGIDQFQKLGFRFVRSRHTLHWIRIMTRGHRLEAYLVARKKIAIVFFSGVFFINGDKMWRHEDCAFWKLEIGNLAFIIILLVLVKWNNNIGPSVKEFEITDSPIILQLVDEKEHADLKM